jgi:predicted ATPase
VYERSGYTLVRVPQRSIDERADFVREFIARHI